LASYEADVVLYNRLILDEGAPQYDINILDGVCRWVGCVVSAHRIIRFLKAAFLPWKSEPKYVSMSSGTLGGKHSKKHSKKSSEKSSVLNYDAIITFTGIAVWAICAIGEAFGYATMPSYVSQIGSTIFGIGVGRASKS